MPKNVDEAAQRARLREFQRTQAENRVHPANPSADLKHSQRALGHTDLGRTADAYVARDVPTLPRYRVSAETPADPWLTRPQPSQASKPLPTRLTVGEGLKLVWALLLLWPLWVFPLIWFTH